MIPRRSYKPLIMCLFLLVLTVAGCQGREATPATQATLPPSGPAEAIKPSPIQKLATATVQPSATAMSTASVTPDPTVTLTQVIAPTPTLDPLSPTVVTIEGVDRVTATGTFFPGDGQPPWPGVILSHMSGGNRHVWEENGFADLLVKNGYAVLAIDNRNHGDSGGDPSWDKGEADMRRWWIYFSGREDIDEQRTALIGGSIGANLALFTGSQKSDVLTVVLLSPGLAYNSADLAGAMRAYGDRPLLIVASEDDLFPAAEDARILADLAAGEVETKIYLDAGHGTDMLVDKQELAGLIVNWLDRHVK